MSLQESYRLTDKLLKLSDEQLEIVSEMKEALGGENLLRFVKVETEEVFEAAYLSLGVTQLTLQNTWHVFSSLLPLLQ